MGTAICFKCGSAKFGALIACEQCGVAPKASKELAVSLALSRHLSSDADLAKYSYELRNHLTLSVPNGAVIQASEALRDPQLLAMLGVQSSRASEPVPQQLSAQPSRSISSGDSTKGTTATPSRARTAQLATSVLHQTPFAILGVTTRDDRRRIIERAEERSLDLDHDVCQKARSDLTNPRTRLSAEVAWLPGVSPRKASQLLDSLLENPMAIREESSLPTLAHLNLLAAAFESVDAEHDANDLGEFIQEMAYLVDDLSHDEVLRDINEDRTVSGFPQITASEQVEVELTERKRHYRNVIKDALDRLRPTTLVQVMIDTVDGATAGGQEHAPWLVDDLVDSYEIETQDVLQKEAANVHKLIKAARDAAPSGEAAVKPYVEKLCVVARNWDTIAQPIQLSAKARGTGHESSEELAWAIRSLAVDLFNEHNLLIQSQRLTGLLKERFSEVPEVAERVEEDAEALDGIASSRNKLAEKFKDFSLSGNTFSYKGKAYDVNGINHIGFYRAITTHKTNFVETGKTEKVILTLAFAGGQALNIAIDEQGVLFNKSRSQQIQTVADFYSYLSRMTFDRRVRHYESQIERNGYFVYDECYFYPNSRVEFRGRSFDVNSTSFLRSYGVIEMRKKDFGFLDRVKREVSITKIPQFNTATDTDVLFHLLEKHFGLTWGS